MSQVPWFTTSGVALVVAAVLLVLLLAVWLLYPACVGVAAILRPRRKSIVPVGAGAGPTVSCILVTREGAAAVRQRIANLFDTAYDGGSLDVVVGLDRNARCHPGELADLERVTVVQASHPGKPSALNAAVAAARGAALVFADTYQRFERDTVSHLIAPLADPAIGAVGGNLERGEKWRLQPVMLYWRLERWLRLQESMLHSCVGVTGAVYSMKRESWKELPSGILCDDLYVPMRLVTEGKRVIFEPRAIARDARDVPPQDEFRRKIRTLTGNYQLVREMPIILHPSRNPIWLQFVCHKLLRLISPYFIIGIMFSGLVVTTAVVPAPFNALVALVLGVAAVWLASPSSPHASARSLMLMFAATLLAGWHAFFGDWAVWTESTVSGLQPPPERAEATVHPSNREQVVTVRGS